MFDRPQAGTVYSLMTSTLRGRGPTSTFVG